MAFATNCLAFSNCSAALAAFLICLLLFFNWEEGESAVFVKEAEKEDRIVVVGVEGVEVDGYEVGIDVYVKAGKGRVIVEGVIIGKGNKEWDGEEEGEGEGRGIVIAWIGTGAGKIEVILIVRIRIRIRI